MSNPLFCAECGHSKPMHANLGGENVHSCVIPGCDCPAFDHGVAINRKTPAELRAEIRLLKEQLAAKKGAMA
jgi:hypothetical protein